ncbi:class I SAM-dependent methyltransferase [Cyanobium sp. Cruz CV13-4-11]|jgi:SAM-dependent methyltransferase|uniref:class I SAM-dependent methyltransferase n=1 Tax=unclassified Cyanobium TaxID=2627006 RepID=UPI0020CEF1A7|nr:MULTISPECIES: class I SAM-dependent methyltransferase [unclassified Cyanobium]MCP9901110.1 class I SAM-dependent methyltransferase [Cyanobium sp. Cruz CV11-17]MCP9920270.1 class I SAM-dependent methyltransferase [Cyanobium sp. Cruz CV13-4-11]
MSTKDAFTRIYQRDTWGGGSGQGSRPEFNGEYIATLQRFMRLNDIHSVVDFGCGDWQFSRLIHWGDITYTGIDIVDSVVAANSDLHASDSIHFQLFEDLASLPPADLILVKDVLQHLPNHLVREYLDHFKAHYRWLIITNDDLPHSELNRDIDAGAWRPLRLDLPPFEEHCSTLAQWVVLTEASMNLHRKRAELILGAGARQPQRRPGTQQE